MNELLLIALTAAVVNNLVLDSHRSGAPHDALRGIDAALAVAVTTWLTLLLATTAAYPVRQLWPESVGGEDFATLVLLVACTAAAALIVAATHRVAPRLHGLLRNEVALLAGGSALLGLAVQRTAHGAFSAQLLAAVNAGLVFVTAQTMLAGLCERLDRADVPAPLRGPAIVLATAGLLSLAFLGFTGIAGL